MWLNLEFTADLVTFTEEILYGKLPFLFTFNDNDNECIWQWVKACSFIKKESQAQRKKMINIKLAPDRP